MNPPTPEHNASHAPREANHFFFLPLSPVLKMTGSADISFKARVAKMEHKHIRCALDIDEPFSLTVNEFNVPNRISVSFL